MIITELTRGSGADLREIVSIWMVIIIITPQIDIALQSGYWVCPFSILIIGVLFLEYWCPSDSGHSRQQSGTVQL